MRKFSKDSLTWKAFERVLMNREAGLEDEYLGMMSRGAAINMAMQLNAAQSQYQVENSLPNGMILYSAKAKAVEGEDWTVEISRNHTKQGRGGESASILHQLASGNQGAVNASQPASADYTSAEGPMSDQELYDWFVDLNRKSIAATGYPFIPGPKMEAAVGRVRAGQDTYLTRMQSQPAEESAQISSEELAAWETARKLRGESYDAANNIGDGEIWNCPKCGLPQLGRKTSIVLVDAENMYQRVCLDCAPGNIKEAASKLAG